MERRREVLARIALVVGSLAFALLSAELAFRLLGLSWPAFYRPDPVLGQALIPEAEGLTDAERPRYIRINSAGFRDRERTLAKPPGGFRVALLGDSYVEGKSLSDDETLTALLERELASCPALAGRPVEALNFGIAGSGTAQQLLVYRHRARPYDPDFVVLAFFAGNDLRNNSLRIQQGGRPYFVERNGELVPIATHLDSWWSRLRAGPLGRAYYEAIPHSRVLQLVNALSASRRRNEILARRAEQERLAPERGLTGAELGLDTAIYREPAPGDAWDEAWRITERLLVMLHGEVTGDGAGFLLASLSTGIQVHPDPAVRAAFQRALGVEDLFLPERRLGALAERESLPALLLAPELRAWAEENDTCVHGFVGAVPCGGHWNEHANRLAARRIAERVCSDVAERRTRLGTDPAAPAGTGDRPTLPEATPPPLGGKS
jgi:hypothetical protein